MPGPRNERLTLALLLAVLLGHLFLLSTDLRTRGSRFERLTLAAFGPVAHGSFALRDGAAGALDNLRLAGSLRQENHRLISEVDRLRHELARLQGVEERLERLAATSGYTRPLTGDTFVADVVFLDSESWLRTLVLYTGTAEPRRNQPVFTEHGVVGRVVVEAGRYAKVLLLTDRSFSISAMLARTRQRGMVRGAGAGRLAFDFIPQQADVQIGDEVVSAGIDGIFPRGLRIGQVASIQSGQDLFQRIEIAPAVDLGRLDQVFVLSHEELPTETAEALSTDNPPDSPLDEGN